MREPEHHQPDRGGIKNPIGAASEAGGGAVRLHHGRPDFWRVVQEQRIAQKSPPLPGGQRAGFGVTDGRRKGVHKMLVLFCKYDLDEEQKNKLRDLVKEDTGENCLILGPAFTGMRQVHVKKDKVKVD